MGNAMTRRQREEGASSERVEASNSPSPPPAHAPNPPRVYAQYPSPNAQYDRTQQVRVKEHSKAGKAASRHLKLLLYLNYY